MQQQGGGGAEASKFSPAQQRFECPAAHCAVLLALLFANSHSLAKLLLLLLPLSLSLSLSLSLQKCHAC